jgi:sugar lactone lactonase YvrE
MTSLLSEPAPLEAVLARPHGLLEGPRITPEGVVFSDVIAGGLFRVADGAVSELLPRRRGIGGLVPHREGGFVLTGRSILHLRADGEQRELLAIDGVAGFNDLSTAANGDLLVGALRYRPLAGELPQPGMLVRLPAEGSAETLSEDVIWPNGVGVSPDGSTVYLSDYARRRVLAFPADGGAAEVFAESPRGSADGLAVDADGGVWVALGEGGGVARFTPAGQLHAIADVPARFVSSLCFGGDDGRDVAITTADNLHTPETGGCVFMARSDVAGLPVAPAAV